MALSIGFEEFKLRLQTNPKLGVAIVALVVAVWAYGFLELMDFSESLEQQRIAAEKKLALISSLAREEFWEERKLQSQELLKAIEGKLWPIQNEGLVRANLQSELAQLAEKNGLERVRIQVDAQPTIDKKAPNFKRFTASLTAGSVKLEAVENFLDALSHEEHHFILQNFELRSKPFPFFKITLAVLMPVVAEKGKNATAQNVQKGSQR